MSKPRNAYRLFPHVCKFLDETVSRKRKELKITQYDLAEKAGLTRNCIQQMECHEHMPLPSTMFKLLRALEFSEEEASRFWAGIDDAYAQARALHDDEADASEVGR